MRNALPLGSGRLVKEEDIDDIPGPFDRSSSCIGALWNAFGTGLKDLSEVSSQITTR
jgi:hypothetical protein